MEFDKSKVYTALNADELKVGSKVILADDLSWLKVCVHYGDGIVPLVAVKSEEYNERFFDGDEFYNFAYLVEPPEEKKLKWTDLKIGDVIRCDDCFRMVIGIDTYETNNHIFIGGWLGGGWLSDGDLEDWEKVEE